VPDFVSDLHRLSAELAHRTPELRVLESYLMTRGLETEVYPAGHPVERGWISSFFGERVDPITGRLATHSGLDFAGRAGSDVIAVATGVVMWSGARPGYATASRSTTATATRPCTRTTAGTS
jgi:murein DD-endopeptidase MepM/ murein hydrolase activator NlpD